MKTQRKNTVLNILGNPRTSTTMMCSFRCDRDLWNDFSTLCALQEKDKTGVLTSYIEDLVNQNRDKIDAMKRLKWQNL